MPVTAVTVCKIDSGILYKPFHMCLFISVLILWVDRFFEGVNTHLYKLCFCSVSYWSNLSVVFHGNLMSREFLIKKFLRFLCVLAGGCMTRGHHIFLSLCLHYAFFCDIVVFLCSWKLESAIYEKYDYESTVPQTYRNNLTHLLYYAHFSV